MHARTASGVLLALGFADLCALNLALAPRLAARTEARAGGRAQPEAAMIAPPRPEVKRDPGPPRDIKSPRNTEPPRPAESEPAPVATPDVLFEIGTARFTSAAALHDLRRLALDLRADPARSAVVRGHADRLGSRGQNLDLSRRRAELVARLLVLYGAPPDRVTIEARGDAEPAAAGDTPPDWARNRRVQIFIR